MSERYTVLRRQQTTGFSVQPPGADLDGPPLDEGAQTLQAGLRQMGVVVRFVGEGWYEARDATTGLTRYRWRTLRELRRQLFAEHGVDVPPEEGEAEDPVPDPVKEVKVREKKGSAEARQTVEPNITRIERRSGFVVFEVKVFRDQKLTYGGRFPTLELARAKRDALRGYAAPHPEEAPVQASAEISVEESRALRDETVRSLIAQAPVGETDAAQLLRLFAAALQAEKALAGAREGFDEAYRIREEAWMALQAFMASEKRKAAG